LCRNLAILMNVGTADRSFDIVAPFTVVEK